MVQDYNEYKIVSARKNGESASLIRIKSKDRVFPGQYYICWVAGFGEETLPICYLDGENIEFSIPKTKSIFLKLSELKPKDSIFLRGPYGHGFPMNNLKNKNIILIGDNTLFSPLNSAVGYLEINKKEYRDVLLIIKHNDENDEFIDTLKKYDGKRDINAIFVKTIEEIKELIKNEETKSTDYLLCETNDGLRDLISCLKEIGVSDKQIYFYLNRKISCGVGICGSCAVFGVHTCIEGPVFRADHLLRF